MLSFYNTERWTATFSYYSISTHCPPLSFNCSSKAFADIHDRILCHECETLLNLNFWWWKKKYLEELTWRQILSWRLNFPKISLTEGLKKWVKLSFLGSTKIEVLSTAYTYTNFLCQYPHHHNLKMNLGQQQKIKYVSLSLDYFSCLC